MNLVFCVNWIELSKGESGHSLNCSQTVKNLLWRTLCSQKREKNKIVDTFGFEQRRRKIVKIVHTGKVVNGGDEVFYVQRIAYCCLIEKKKENINCELVSLLSAQCKVFTSKLIWLLRRVFAATFRQQHQPSTLQYIVILFFVPAQYGQWRTKRIEYNRQKCGIWLRQLSRVRTSRRHFTKMRSD